MATVTRPKVTLLEKGEKLTTKLMETDAGNLLPRHKASLESVLVVVEGECVLELDGTDHVLAQGASMIVPANVWHQIRANQDLKAVHAMPTAIRFEYSS